MNDIEVKVSFFFFLFSTIVSVFIEFGYREEKNTFSFRRFSMNASLPRTARYTSGYCFYYRQSTNDSFFCCLFQHKRTFSKRQTEIVYRRDYSCLKYTHKLKKNPKELSLFGCIDKDCAPHARTLTITTIKYHKA